MTKAVIPKRSTIEREIFQQQKKCKTESVTFKLCSSLTQLLIVKFNLTRLMKQYEIKGPYYLGRRGGRQGKVVRS